MHDWPTREEWAKTRTTCYIDPDDPRICVSERVSDYLEDWEATALVTRLRTHRKELGKQLRAMDKRHKEQVDFIRKCRSTIFQTLKWLENDRIPYNRHSEAVEELHDLRERRQSAWNGEADRIRAQVARTPVDDEAWAEELEHRKKQDEYAANENNFIHEVSRG